MNIAKVNTSLLSLIPLVATLASSLASADEVMPTMPRRIERTQPDDTALQITGERQREIEAVEKEMKEKRRAFEAGQPPPTQALQATPAPSSGVSNDLNSSNSEAGSGKTQPDPHGAKGNGFGTQGMGQSSKVSLRAVKQGGTGNPSKTQTFRSSFQNSGTGFQNSGAGFQNSGAGFQSFAGGSPLQVFAVSKGPDSDLGTFTVLPTGSHVKARIVSGVEANAREPYPVLLQLDYAFTGPNKTRIDLSHCFMIAKARANLSTERVMMETENLSCVRDDGEHFKREAKGYVAGDDNTFGATGTYISKQGQVLLAAVLASIAKNAGQAIADAQKTTSVLGADKAATASNITGSKAAFVGGSALVDGGAMVAQWYLEQAKELLPSIGVGSGQDVFVVMLDSIKIPNLNTEE